MIRGNSLHGVMRLIRLLQISRRNNIPVELLLEKINESHQNKLQMTRRDVLKGISSAAAVLPFSSLHFLKSSLKARSFQNDDEPVAVIGAGLAGLVVAYRLRQAGIRSVIYEVNNRVGGRVFTKRNFNSDGMFCELGGELIDSRHRAMFALCRELGLEVQDINSGDRGLNKQLFYSQGRLITENQMFHAFKPLAIQVEKDVKEIFGHKKSKLPTYRDQINPKLIQYDRMSLSEYLSQKKDVDQWVIDLIEVLYACEYGLECSEQSALNFLSLVAVGTDELSLLGESDESFRVSGGNSFLVEALLDRVKSSVPIFYEHELVRIQEKGSRIQLSFHKGKSTVDYSYRQVVCTIPFSVLRTVEGISQLPLRPKVRESIFHLGYGTNSKLMMSFKTKPWRDHSKYPSNGMLMTVAEQQFWDTSRMQKGKSGILTNFLGGRAGAKISPHKIENNMLLLNEVFQSSIRGDYDRQHILQHWSSYPGAMGSYICFKPGQYTAMHGVVAEPELGGKLLFAGEHTSVEHCGFMNGAVDSGNRAADCIVAQARRELSPNLWQHA